jgi:hypothetical protein
VVPQHRSASSVELTLAGNALHEQARRLSAHPKCRRPLAKISAKLATHDQMEGHGARWNAMERFPG